MNQGYSLGCVLLLLCLVISLSEHLQQPEPDKDKRTDLSAMKVWVTLPDQPCRPAQVLAKGKGVVDWRVDDGAGEEQLWPWDQMQQRDCSP